MINAIRKVEKDAMEQVQRVEMNAQVYVLSL